MKLYLGGDVSKGYADWVILSDKKQTVLENFQLDDTYNINLGEGGGFMTRFRLK